VRDARYVRLIGVVANSSILNCTEESCPRKWIGCPYSPKLAKVTAHWTERLLSKMGKSDRNLPKWNSGDTHLNFTDLSYPPQLLSNGQGVRSVLKGIGWPYFLN
jgi:hypothetical protein